MPVRHTSWATPMRYHALFEGLRASLASVHVWVRSTTPPTRRARPKSDAGFSLTFAAPVVAPANPEDFDSDGPLQQVESARQPRPDVPGTARRDPNLGEQRDIEQALEAASSARDPSSWRAALATGC